MSLARLDVTNVRNIETASIDPSNGLNFIVGPNGSGKTSLLESIYILGMARSFRCTQAGRVIRFQQDKLTVTGKVCDDYGLPSLPIGVSLSRGAREILLAGTKLHSSADLVRAFPVLLIHPPCIALLDDAPRFRRQFLDWGAFHFDDGFLENWRSYSRALRQRNALLRAGRVEGIEIWNHELSRYGTIVAQTRMSYADRLRPFFLEASELFLGSGSHDLRISPGWNIEKGLSDTLSEEIPSDLRDGFTHSGAHRADFVVFANARPVRNYLSRGQMKLIVLALYLAQAHLLEQSIGTKGCVLIDDLSSELDNANHEKLLGFLASRKLQLFISATDARYLKHPRLKDFAMFHVEHGRVRAT